MMNLTAETVLLIHTNGFVNTHIKFWCFVEAVVVFLEVVHHSYKNLSQFLSKSGNISTRCSSTKRSGSFVHILEHVFEHMEDILEAVYC